MLIADDLLSCLEDVLKARCTPRRLASEPRMSLAGWLRACCTVLPADQDAPGGLARPDGREVAGREGEDSRKVECGRYVEAASRTGTQVNGGE